MKEIKKILVPIDFSENSPKILNTAMYVAGKFDAKLILVFVAEENPAYERISIPHISLDLLAEEYHKYAIKKMEKFITKYLDPAMPHETAVMRGDVADEISKHAKKTAADMIIMGTHGYKGLEKVLFGSVAERLVKEAPCPVMTINPYK